MRLKTWKRNPEQTFELIQVALSIAEAVWPQDCAGMRLIGHFAILSKEDGPAEATG